MSFMPAKPEQPVLSVHPDKQVISLTGENVRDFLNDILTAQINSLASNTARAACLLSPQGRILFDMVVMSAADSVYLVTEADQATPLTKRLMMYRLRRKIEITVRPELRAGHIWEGVHSDFSLPDSFISARDERHKALGSLVLFSNTDGLPSQEEEEYWQVLRISLGVPEGTADLTPNRALMLEAGLHLLGAIDFEKGCYVGQEVTARTHYRGLVKRRLLPVSTSGRLTSGQGLQRGDTDIGKIGSTANLPDGGNIALASLRLDAVRDSLSGTAELTTDNGQIISLHIPDWMHPLPGFDKGRSK
ncbi:MAG: hypothetical protein CMM80_06180 [Rhodospirillaceae bacterium]|nr:hypothetical protein [Rhodospirillaceae bacterium]